MSVAPLHPGDGLDTVVAPETEELLLAVHRAAAVRAQSRLDAAVAMGRDDVAGSLDALLPLDAARRRDWSVWFAVWSVADTSPDLAAEHRRFLASTFDDLRRVVTAAQGTGRLPADVDVDRWTRQALAALHEVAVSALLDPSSWPDERQRSAVARLAGLPADPPAPDDLVVHAAVVLQDRDDPVRDGPDPPP